MNVSSLSRYLEVGHLIMMAFLYLLGFAMHVEELVLAHPRGGVFGARGGVTFS